MTNSLQDLIDASIFISTEYQARLAELVGTSEWNVDFTSQSLDFETVPPLSLKPHLLGTESENRGTWIWSWQQLGYFPDSVVSAAIQAREAGERDGLVELTTDELPLSESLARRLTLAAKTLSGLYAHYPLPAGAGVRAWTLLEGHELALEAPTYKGIGRVIAKTLQSEEIHNQVLAVDSYAQQRGFHIAWDTEATAVLTATDGALRLWFDDGRISGIEEAEPQVGPEVLEQCAAAAAQRRESLAAARTEIERIAAAEAAAQSAQREQEAAERAAARAEAERAVEIAEHAPVADTYEAPAVEAQPAPAEQPVEEHEPEQARVYTDASIGAEDEQPVEAHEAPAEQAPAEQHAEEPEAYEAQGEYTEEEIAEYVEPIHNAGDAPDLPAEHEEAAHEEYERQHFEERSEEEQQKPEPKKKGFFSRFFGL
ncbi:DUF6882 domain-containing protein [Rothia sp. HMSC068F09]|uniref:DUF6882 domain-containing protein n=1 Tax=Rothia sp. HMSC068F09 TaxID=1739378 RepID=UPI0008A6622D|nr:DUF6882 domain-containing protein [Rothia sp. HMSC068F09]OFR67801.1 hydrolase [Rothia sp. HMSC068F09]